MKYIELGGGTQAIVDDEDFQELSQWNWHFDGKYARAIINGSRIRMHVWLNGPYTDHANGDKLDYRRQNLRRCTNQQNQQNSRKKGHAPSSPYKGVSWSKEARRWRVYLWMNYKRFHIGYFDNEIHAAMAYDINATACFGEFARTNFVKANLVDMG